MEAINLSQFAGVALRNMNKELGDLMEGDCIFVKCHLIPPLDDEFRVVVEEIVESKSEDDSNKHNHLIILLETEGGFMETVERLVSVMRAHYQRVSFVIPNFAYSAGTVLALSGDDIYMDYYSVLGPIDPQEPDAEGGRLLPGVGYLAKFKELAKIINDPNLISTAEMTYLVKKFDPARLFRIEQAINHGRSLITEWLPKYKFKDWEITESKKNEVSIEMKEQRATQIAKVLGDAEKWHSHGRGISMKELSGPEIKLKIIDFGEMEPINKLIRHYHGLCVDHFSRVSSFIGYIHSSHGVRRVL